MKQEQGGMDLGVNAFPFQSNFDDEFIPSKRINTGNGTPITKEDKMQWSFGPNDYSRDEEKRKQKLKSNDVKKERERREKMADLIDELRVLIPNCGDNGKKLNQSNVMSYAVEYIRNLHTTVLEMKQEILFLKGQGGGVDLGRAAQVVIADEPDKVSEIDHSAPIQPKKAANQNSIFMLGDIEDVGPWPLYFQQDNKSLLSDWLDGTKPTGAPANSFSLEFDLNGGGDNSAAGLQNGSASALLNAPFNGQNSQLPTLQQQRQQLLQQQQQQLIQQQLQQQALRQQLQQQQLQQLQDQQQFRNNAIQNTLQSALQNTIQNTLQSAMQNINILPSNSNLMQPLQTLSQFANDPATTIAMQNLTTQQQQQLLSHPMFQQFAINPNPAATAQYLQAYANQPQNVLPQQYNANQNFNLSNSFSAPNISANRNTTL